ncbi:uncharacterized protein LOC143018440 [Oratosquilla oratoria]|uniref:uncharacterized protein LOC143018440 n=1 Tax=Oratosquilla oratoria TaxID=337810 RepID=UPI003F75B34C
MGSASHLAKNQQVVVQLNRVKWVPAVSSAIAKMTVLEGNCVATMVVVMCVQKSPKIAAVPSSNSNRWSSTIPGRFILTLFHLGCNVTTHVCSDILSLKKKNKSMNKKEIE